MSDRNCSCACHDGGMRDPSCDRACFACGEAPSPLAREAVGEFEKEYVPACPSIGKHLFTAEVADFTSWLLATISRVEAATEARVRAEVWGKAHGLVYEDWDNANSACVNDGASPETEIIARFLFDLILRIRESALADGVDLTSLAKEK